MDDLVGEVLLRFPPDEPELLIRAALVSKRWCRLISDTLLAPIGTLPEVIDVVHFVDGIGALFIKTKDVLLKLDLKSFRVRKLYEGRRIHDVLPYKSFYTPAFRAACKGEGPTVVAPTA